MVHCWIFWHHPVKIALGQYEGLFDDSLLHDLFTVLKSCYGRKHVRRAMDQSGGIYNTYFPVARDSWQRKPPLSSGYALWLGSVYCHCSTEAIQIKECWQLVLQIGYSTWSRQFNGLLTSGCLCLQYTYLSYRIEQLPFSALPVSCPMERVNRQWLSCHEGFQFI